MRADPSGGDETRLGSRKQLPPPALPCLVSLDASSLCLTSAPPNRLQACAATQRKGITPRQPQRTMHLMYYLNEKGERVYTLKKSHGEEEQPTLSAHPARFSPDDKFSAQRLACKKRFGLLPTQKERDAL